MNKRQKFVEFCKQKPRLRFNLAVTIGLVTFFIVLTGVGQYLEHFTEGDWGRLGGTVAGIAEVTILAWGIRLNG